MPNKDDFLANDCYIPVAIANGQTTSDPIDLAGTDLCGIEFPAAMTGTNIKLLMASSFNGVYKTVQKDEVGGGDYTITVTANKYVPITNLAIPAGLRFIKLVSSSTEGADRALVLATRPL
jgi:hypothetical protein